jgi:hypothetical protein
MRNSKRRVSSGEAEVARKLLAAKLQSRRIRLAFILSSGTQISGKHGAERNDEIDGLMAGWPGRGLTTS